VQEFPQARIAVFSATQDEFVIRQAQALGAVGYVPKGAVAAEILGTLSRCSGRRRGRRARASPPTRRCSRACRRRRCTTASPSSAPRHLEILELVLSGCNNQEISNSMRLSLGTVKNYVSSLLLALDVRSRAHLVSLFR
jgi:NarL family two-component system response regulator LiaR